MRKDIAHKVKLLVTKNRRLCAVKYKNDLNDNVLIVFVYMPCDKRMINSENYEFQDVMEHI